MISEALPANNNLIEAEESLFHLPHILVSAKVKIRQNNLVRSVRLKLLPDRVFPLEAVSNRSTYYVFAPLPFPRIRFNVCQTNRRDASPDFLQRADVATGAPTRNLLPLSDTRCLVFLPPLPRFLGKGSVLTVTRLLATFWLPTDHFLVESSFFFCSGRYLGPLWVRQHGGRVRCGTGAAVVPANNKNNWDF